MPRRFTSVCITAVLALCLSAPTPQEATPSRVDHSPAIDASADVLTTGRMRKLHLVRPDLIPYPVFFEVFC
jgi:hypothetical protein